MTKFTLIASCMMMGRDTAMKRDIEFLLQIARCDAAMKIFSLLKLKIIRRLRIIFQIIFWETIGNGIFHSPENETQKLEKIKSRSLF